ncbi:MAG TPA: hypothetical protein GXZ35_08380 [Acholeplasmataceae bacterium]|nr:hypothetical protein [Acholeplasmataceae bacterium]
MTKKLKEELKEDTKKEIKEVSKKKPGRKPKSETKEKKVVEKITKTSNARSQRDMNELIRVVCITNAPLVYESRSQLGYRVYWDGYLSEAWMEYKELINMRNTYRAFFERPWIICDWDVLEDLRVEQYYKNIIDLENLDDVFKKTPKELEKTLKEIPDGIKALIVDRAFELRREKKLDSLSVIETIEKTLNVDLTV